MEAWEKMLLLFGADMTLSVHFDNKTKNFLIIGEGSTQGLDDTALTAETKYPISFTQPGKTFVLVYTITEAVCCYSLMLQKYINSKQKKIKNYCIGFR